MTAEFADVYDPLLEWVYDRAIENDLGDVDIRPFAEQHGFVGPQAFALLRYAKAKGTMDDRRSTMGIPAASLTSLGIEVMEDRRRRRASPVARSAAAQRGLLLWLWAQRDAGVGYPVVDKILEEPESMFQGTRLSADNIDRAAAYLAEKGLIRGMTVDQRRGPIRAEITAEGQDCVEHFDGDVGAYERRNSSGNTTFNIGSNTGNIAANSRDFTLNATTNNGIDPARVVMLARALRQAAPVLELPEGEAAEFVRLATSLEEEAGGGNPDPARLQRWGASMLAILNSPVVSGALGSVLATYTGMALPGLPGS